MSAANERLLLADSSSSPMAPQTGRCSDGPNLDSSVSFRRPLPTGASGQLDTFEGYAKKSGKQSPAGGQEPPTERVVWLDFPLVDEVTQ